MGANVSVFQGRLGADAEMKELKSGTTVVNFRMANTRTFKDKDGDRQEETTWMRVAAYNGVASGIVDFLVKGKEVTVIGRIRSFEYEKEEISITGYEIVAAEVVLGANPRKRDDDEDNEDERPSRKRSSSSSKSRSSAKPKSSSRRSRDEDEDEDAEGGDEAPW